MNFTRSIILILITCAFSCCVSTEEERGFFKSLDLGSKVFKDHQILISAYGKLCFVDVDTMHKKYINNSEGFMASLSNRNDQIVFLKNEKLIINKMQRRRFFYEIWIMDIDGNNKHLLKRPASFCSMPVFSKEDNLIYYLRMNEPQYERNKQLWTFDVYYLDLNDEALTEHRLTNINSEYFHTLKLTASNELMLQVEKSYGAKNTIYMYDLEQNNLYTNADINSFEYGQNYFAYSNSMNTLYSIIISDQGFKISLYKTDLKTNQKTKITSDNNDKLYLNALNAEVSPDGDNILFYLRGSHDGLPRSEGYVESHAFLCNISSGSVKKVFFDE